jgi:predicted PurR-regulated permease PerM
MNGRTLLGAFALLVLGLLTWELRWVLLVLFGAVVLAVALDVPITTARRLLPLNRPTALVGVLLVLVLVGGLLAQLLLPELLDQFTQLTSLLPALAQRLSSLARQISWMPNLESQLMELGTWDRLQPLGSQLLGFAGGAASTTLQLVLMALLAILLALDPRSHQQVVVA